jgi:hypothetical protein
MRAPTTFVRKTDSIWSICSSESRARSPVSTALVTRPPRGPNVLSTVSKVRMTSASLRTSAAIAMALPPADSIPCTSREAASELERYVTATGMPPWAACLATSAPIPTAPPVTTKAPSFSAT